MSTTYSVGYGFAHTRMDMCQRACVGLKTMSLEEGPKLTKQQKAIRASLYRVQNLDIYRSTNTALDTECFECHFTNQARMKVLRSMSNACLNPRFWSFEALERHVG